MLGFLIGVPVALLVFLIVRAKYRVKQWRRLMERATQEQDLQAAAALFGQACEYAGGKKRSPIMKACARTAQQSMGHTLFRAGDLDRAAAMSFEELQLAKGNP
jgi:hypothetical protein